jgi:hypothetical protein
MDMGLKPAVRPQGKPHTLALKVTMKLNCEVNDCAE